MRRVRLPTYSRGVVGIRSAPATSREQSGGREDGNSGRRWHEADRIDANVVRVHASGSAVGNVVVERESSARGIRDSLERHRALRPFRWESGGRERLVDRQEHRREVAGVGACPRAAEQQLQAIRPGGGTSVVREKKAMVSPFSKVGTGDMKETERSVEAAAPLK